MNIERPKSAKKGTERGLSQDKCFACLRAAPGARLRNGETQGLLERKVELAVVSLYKAVYVVHYYKRWPWIGHCCYRSIPVVLVYM